MTPAKQKADEIKDFGSYVLYIAERVDKKKSGKPLMSKKERKNLINQLYKSYKTSLQNE